MNDEDNQISDEEENKLIDISTAKNIVAALIKERSKITDSIKTPFSFLSLFLLIVELITVICAIFLNTFILWFSFFLMLATLVLFGIVIFFKPENLYPLTRTQADLKRKIKNLKKEKKELRAIQGKATRYKLYLFIKNERSLPDSQIPTNPRDYALTQYKFQLKGKDILENQCGTLNFDLSATTGGTGSLPFIFVTVPPQYHDEWIEIICTFNNIDFYSMFNARVGRVEFQ